MANGCNLPKDNNGVCSHLWGSDCGYKCCRSCPANCNSRCKFSERKKRVKKGLIGALAHCEDCDWEDEDYKTAQHLARIHAWKTGHTVHVETVYSQTYNPKEGG